MAILAATAIIALEDSGIIGRSKNTVNNNNYLDEYTRLQVIKNGILTDNLGEITVDEYITELQNKGIINNVVTNGDGTKTVTTTSGFDVIIGQNTESDLNITIDGYTPPSSNNGGGNGNTPTPTPTITLNKTSIAKTINSGSTATETITATTTNVSGTLTWTSSNTSVATVSASGNTATITMKAAGTAIITAKYGSTSASCTVTVTQNSASTVTITSATITNGVLNNGDTVTFNATLNKSNVSQKLKYRLNIDYYYVYTTPTEFVENCYTYEFESTEATVSYSYSTSNHSTGYYSLYLVHLDVLDENNNVLTTYIFDEYNSSDTHIYVNDSIDYTYHITCMPAGTLILVEEEYEDENGKKKKRRRKKRIEELTYDDDLVVWDFDNGCFTTAKPLWLKKKEYADEYNELTFSNGAVLKTVREHRIFNKELGKFTYPMGEETRLGTTTFTEDGEEVTLVNRRVVDEKVEYYNVITNYHINAFAEGILTSCRLSNLYDIKDMKYVKDDREIVSVKEFKDIPEEYYYGLRLGEQRRNVNNEGDFSDLNSWTEYVNRLISRKK